MVPVQSITSIAYDDASAGASVLDGAAYALRRSATQSSVSLVSGQSWPVTSGAAGNVTVTFVAGYGADAATVPPGLRHALLLLLEHFYYNRSAVADVSKTVVPFGVDALLGPYKTHGWI